MKEKKLKIYYDAPLDSELDKSLRKAAEKHCWVWYASGMSYPQNIGEIWRRDLVFYKKGSD